MIGSSSWRRRRASSKRRNSRPTAIPARAESLRSALEEGDKLIGVQITDGQREILLGPNKASRSASRKRKSGPWAGPPTACKGITLEEGNEVIGMETITPDSTTAILTVTEGGYGKRTPVERVSCPGAWRQGHHQREDDRTQRPGHGFLAGPRRRSKSYSWPRRARFYAARWTTSVRSAATPRECAFSISMARTTGWLPWRGLAESAEREEAGPDEALAT